MGDEGRELLVAEGISKSFFGVSALKDVGYRLDTGRALGLVGENGAGKSTLMNILGGALRPDAGKMRLDGESFSPQTPREAEEAGIAFIHQELNLFGNLSIAENLFISRLPRRWSWLPLIDRRRLESEAGEALRQVGLELDPRTPVQQLAAGERQLVEIAKALQQRARIIIFDEPTTSLAQREAERLFGIIDQLKEQGIALVYISHSLDHILRLCDRCLVLRDGGRVAEGPVSDFSIGKLVSLMVGRPIDNLFPERKARPRSDVALRAIGLSEPHVIRDISFEARRGEVLGISGLMGSGRSELLRILFGLDPCSEGELQLNGVSLMSLRPRQRLRAGLAFLTEDRRGEGLAMEGSIRENLALVALPEYARRGLGLIDGKRLGADLEELGRVTRLDVTDRLNQPVKTLSGGNQQKVALGKWLLSEPQALLLDEPTRGIDVGAKFEIYGLIDRLASEGRTVVMVSSEMEELIGLCDRILVLSHGEVTDVIEPHEFDRERILNAALQGKAKP